jgi:hypothetical protein
MDPEERKVDFVSRDEVGVVAAGVEEASASGYTIVDRA